MLRIHFLQHWLSYLILVLKKPCMTHVPCVDFVGIDLGREPVPDETTICKFRHLMEKYNLGDELFQIVNIYLERERHEGVASNDSRCHDHQCTEFDQNKDKKRDPEMHQTRKGNQWYFGMKAHVGVDSRTKMIHSVVATAGNVHDSQVLQDLLHGDETRVWGDSAYAGQGAVIREHAPNAKDFTNQKGFRNRALTDEDAARNRTKSKVRAKVEHPFLILKRVFGFNKVRLPWVGQECYSAVCCMRIGQSIHGAKTIVETNIGNMHLNAVAPDYQA